MARLKSLSPPIQTMRQRIVVHHQTAPEAVDELIACVREMKEEVEAGQKTKVNAEADQLSEEDKMKTEGKLRTRTVLGY
jgi:hypothetical protein